METQTQKVSPILEVAWTRFAQLDALSLKRSKSHIRLRWWVATLGVLATLFAILTEIVPQGFSPVISFILKMFLIATPILASGMAAFVKWRYSSGDWLVARAGAEEILKEIYAYRTILQNEPTRRAWLEKRLEEIQRSVYSGMNGELILEPHKGALPPTSRFNPSYPNTDPGFHDLTGEEYFRFRLENELGWHTKEVNKRQKERTRLQILIFIAGGLGAFIAAWGSPVSLWVALTAAFTAAMLGWQELRNIDAVIRNYSKVIIELTILSDHWKNLEGNEINQTEFYRMVRSAEDILWAQNMEYIKSQQEALKDADLEEEASLITRVIKEQRESDRRLKKAFADAVVDYTDDALQEAEENLTETFRETLGSLAEEASSELVQAELAAMQEALEEAVENFTEKLGLSSTMQSIEEDYKGVTVDANVPMKVLNEILARNPKTGEIKG
ncbi:MAG: SLATT domain-containing protein [Anaerolineales bacterium]|nr:SLATT domain-containing protein [Anaerolineales bacterium]MBP6209755.1 SLATT domain-containing protein [Anaerolineales bacterium]